MTRPAFPRFFAFKQNGHLVEGPEGQSLREWYVGMALLGASEKLYALSAEDVPVLAAKCVALADAALALVTPEA